MRWTACVYFPLGVPLAPDQKAAKWQSSMEPMLCDNCLLIFSSIYSSKVLLRYNGGVFMLD